MYKTIAFLAMILTSMLTACIKQIGEHVYSFNVKDNSGKGFGLLVGESYPDTTVPDLYDDIKGVPPNQSLSIDSKIKWEKYFDALPSDTLSLFLFSGDTLQKYTWPEIRAGYKIIKRIDLSLEDLISKNYTISYP